MSFKNGGYKTKYISEYGYMKEEYTIYAAEECCSETMVYKMFDDKGIERNIIISAEDDNDGYGNRSLIDCLYYLKNRENKTYRCSDNNIVVEEMSSEEMKEVFGH